MVGRSLVSLNFGRRIWLGSARKRRAIRPKFAQASALFGIVLLAHTALYITTFDAYFASTLYVSAKVSGAATSRSCPGPKTSRLGQNTQRFDLISV